jgi:hypothetical protein
MKHYIPDQSNCKCVRELDCANLSIIQKEILGWVDQNTDFLENTSDTMFWKKIDYKDMARAAPSLLRFMRSVSIPIREITVGLLTEAMKDTGFVLHHGSPPLNFKINFPILNTEDVWTEWYRIPCEDLQKLPLLKNVHTELEQYDLSSLHTTVAEKYPCSLRYNMHKNPIIFNSLIPHRVMPGPKAKFPRIMLAIMPIKDPIDLMTIEK